LYLEESIDFIIDTFFCFNMVGFVF